MTQTPKPSNAVRVGIIGDGERLATLAAKASDCPLVEIVAQSGMSQGDAIGSAQWYSDPRELIRVQVVEAVLFAGSTRDENVWSESAAQFDLPIWKMPPAGRGFADAVSLRDRFQSRSRVCRIASWWEHVAAHAWGELNWPREFQIRYSELRFSGPGPLAGAWKGRAADSAGGALADAAAYALLEALIAVRGLPESVYAVTARLRATVDGGLTPETEDTAIATFRYADGGVAALRATWNLPPFEQQLVHHADGFSVALTDQDVRLSDATGTLIDSRPLGTDFLGEELLRFAEAVRSDGADRAKSSLDRHLAVAAVLESTYLSARTNQPESPHKMYSVQNLAEPAL